MQITGAQILIEELIKHGVDTLFGYPGGTVIDIYDQLFEQRERIKHIITADESGAAHAADGYSRVSGKVGVVIGTSGPGATNLVTGIATAYLDSTPMIFITGNVGTSMLGKDSFQEVDIIGITQPIVKHSFLVRDVKELESIVKQAFMIATSDRNGPVLIDIPKDMQQALCEYPNININLPKITEEEPEIDYYNAVNAINKCTKPFIYCGGGVVSAGASKEILALSQKLSAPIGMSMMGLSAIPNSYELNLGMTGMHGKYAASMVRAEADLLIAVGVRFSDRATGNVKEYSKNCTIIHIDIDPAEINKNIHSRISLCGDIRKVVSDLFELVEEKHNDQWQECINQYLDKQALIDPENSDFTPNNIIESVRKHCTDDTLVATDVGQHQMWVMQYYRFEKPRTLLTSGGLGTMGFGMGAAIGGSIAKGKQKTVLFTGDGSFGMNLNEMATAVRQKLPIVIVIFNNGSLGMVRQWQTVFYNFRYSQTTLNRDTDFCKLADAFGAKGYCVENLAELKQVLDEYFDYPTPIVIECKIDPDLMVFPMIPPGGTVNDMILK